MLTRRTFLTALASVPLLGKVAQAKPKSRVWFTRVLSKQRYTAEAFIVQPANQAISVLQVRLHDGYYLNKAWEGTLILSPDSPREMLKVKLEHLTLSLLRRAQDETPDYEPIAARCELMQALLPHYQRLSRPHGRTP